MSAVGRLWERFWFREVDGLPLGIFRVGLGLCGLYAWAAQAVLVREFYSDGGQLPIRLARAWQDVYVSRFLMPDWLGSPSAVMGLLALNVVVLVAFTAGYRLRLTATLAFLLVYWFQARNSTFLNGGDDVLRLGFFYMMVAYWALPPVRRALSVDRRRALMKATVPDGSGDEVAGGPGPPSPARMQIWPLRLLQLQVALIYLEAGFWKLWSPEWWDGSALYVAMASPTFGRFGMPEWAWLEYPFIVVTIATAWWEFLFPLLVFWEPTRRKALLFGVAVHGGIAIGMNIGVFPYLMIVAYAVFLRGEEIRASVLFQRAEQFVCRLLKIREPQLEEARVG